MDQFPTSSVNDRRIDVWNALQVSSAIEETKVAARALLMQETVTHEEINAILTALGIAYIEPLPDVPQRPDVPQPVPSSASTAVPQTGDSLLLPGFAVCFLLLAGVAFVAARRRVWQ